MLLTERQALYLKNNKYQKQKKKIQRSSAGVVISTLRVNNYYVKTTADWVANIVDP